MRAVVGVNNDDGPNGNLKRLKLSKKSVNGCKVAGKTAVPRRLRTAMKKRGCDSPSPDSPSIKKQSNSTLENEMPKQNSVKKSKKDATLNWSPRKSFGVTMTKDEEEVAEILFAMASMLPLKEASRDAGYGHYSAQTDKLVLSVATECLTPALEGSRMRSDLGAPAQSVAHEVMSISVNEGKHREETKGAMTLDESVVHKTDVHTKQVPHELNQRKEPLTRMRREMSNNKMMISGSIGFNLESCITFGSQQPKEPMPALNQGTQECTNGSASCRGSHLHHPSIFKGLTSEDCLAWSSGVAMISNESSYPQQMSTSKKPAWIDAAVPYHNPSFGQTYDSKAFRNSFDRISRKRCATHVWIGYLIQELKGGGENASALMPQLHMKQEMNADPEFQVQACPSRLKSNNSNAVSVANLIEARHKPTQDDVKGSIPFLETLKKKPLQNQTPMVYKQEKQALDFLSLSNGDSCVDSSSSKDGTRKGNRSGMWSCLSLGPSNNASRTYRAISTHNDYYSPTYGSQTSAKQVGPHLPTPVGSSDLRLPEKGPRVLTKEQQQMQQQQQMIWAAMAYPQGLHAVKFDPATRIQFSSPMVPSPLDTQFPKYTAMATQHHHQQLASLPRASPMDHCLPTGVQLYSGALPLQLL